MHKDVCNKHENIQVHGWKDQEKQGQDEKRMLSNCSFALVEYSIRWCRLAEEQKLDKEHKKDKGKTKEEATQHITMKQTIIPY